MLSLQSFFCPARWPGFFLPGENARAAQV